MDTRDVPTLLVTGGAGFIGTSFVLGAVARARVVNLDRLTYAGNLENLDGLREDPRHVFVEGDVCDRDLVRSLLARHAPVAIVNFAAESHVDRSIDGPDAFVRTNVQGTFELLEAARAHHARLPPAEASAFRFLQVSTDEVYGSLGAEGRFTEETPFAPSSPYAATKAAADHLVRAYHTTYGLPTLVTHCSNNYGPYQFPEKLIPLMVLNALEGRPLPIYGDGRQVRDWLYVEDHCEALWRVLEAGRPGQSYNLGGESERTNLEVVERLCALVDALAPPLPGRASRRELVTHVRDRPGHDRRYAIDPSKAARELGWRPRHAFESGLERTVRWYLERRAWCDRITERRYARERLGLASQGERA